MNQNRVTLSESVGAATNIKGRKWRARIIEANRWGSSAYYPADVLERDGASVFVAGLPIYRNHPTDSESWERPERNVDDLVGKLVSDAVFEEDGLYADVEFYESFVDRINELHQDVGLSVRASGLTEEAEMDGRYGPVLLALFEAKSVDVVTKAGAGGKLTSIIESDRELAGRPVEEQEGTQSMTDVTKEDFEALQTTLIEAINALPATLAEALKPEPVADGAQSIEESTAEEEEQVTIDHAALLTAVAEAELPSAVIPAIVSALESGTELSEAVKAQTDLREAFTSQESHVGTVVRESADGKATGLARAVEILGR